MTRVISTSTGINGVRLAHHISETRMMTYHFYCIFKTKLGREHSGKASKKFIGNFTLKNRIAVAREKPAKIVSKTRQVQFTQSNFFTNKT